MAQSSNINFFHKNLSYLLRRLALKRNQLASHIKKSGSTVTNWTDQHSYPSIPDLIKLVQYFGVSADVLLFVDMEKTELVTDDDVKDFKNKGKLNLKGVRPYLLFDEDAERGNLTAKEHDPTKEWVILKILKENTEKLDQLLVLAKDPPKKNP